LVIKSLFVPDYALQGQTIPVHVIWEEIECKALRVEFSPELSFNVAYNAKELSHHKDSFVVEGLQNSGYLAFLLDSKSLPECEKN
jgi:hypothetical protein